jgi:hypothetical protein
LRKVCAGAKMDDDLFQLMCNPETREQIRVTPGETYKTVNSGGEVKLQSLER